MGNVNIFKIIKENDWDYVKEFYDLQRYISSATVIIIIIAAGKIASKILSATGVEIPSMYQLYYAAITIILPVVWLFLFMSHVREKNYNYMTGRNLRRDLSTYKRTYFALLEYFKDADPHKLTTESDEFPIHQSWRKTKGIIFGTAGDRLITIPSDSECNIAVFGPPGSGKTSGLVIPNAMNFEGSCLCVDVKGDIYNYVSMHTNRSIIRFCPDDPDALKTSCHFDPLAGINKMSITDKKLFLESMAIILIPDEGGNEGNYFTSRARKLFQGISHLILHEKPDADFPYIVHAILQGNAVDWITKAINSDCQEAKELLASFYGSNERNINGAYDSLTTTLVHFSNPVLDVLLSNDGKSVSIKDLEKGYDVYLQIAQEHLDAYAPLFTLLIESFSNAFKNRPDKATGIKNRPILMLLDEFPQLTFSYAQINSNLATLRSKSVICMVIQQNLSQLEYRYQPIGARSILGNCNFQIILGSNDLGSSKVFSETFGEKKVLKISNSETQSQNSSSGRSIQEATERVYPPEYINDLPSKNKLIIYFKGKHCECTKINCYID